MKYPAAKKSSLQSPDLQPLELKSCCDPPAQLPFVPAPQAGAQDHFQAQKQDSRKVKWVGKHSCAEWKKEKKEGK